ncbi:MAG: hypothetical protein D6705_02055 [Deltaproteobacteria bacterium]|nr:MAG: hypothetical protein D6705_02055 [Deltaproteobacteria bacterium]
MRRWAAPIGAATLDAAVSVVLATEGNAKMRRRDLLLGLVIAGAAAALVFGVAVPWFVGVVLGGASDLDARLRAQDRLMQTVCVDPVPGRDDALCGCALAVPFPSLDCQDRFRPWLAARVAEQCAKGAISATSFCACMQTVDGDLREGGAREDAVRAVPRCLDLPDTPAIDDLAPLIARGAGEGAAQGGSSPGGDHP